MAAPIPAMFVGASRGGFAVTAITAVRGETLAPVERLSVLDATRVLPPGLQASWVLRATTSNLRYVERAEQQALAARTPPLGRPEASVAVMIPIRKSDAWWELPQDERRAILEARSEHIAIGQRYLPAVARKLYHARDLGEPFDFVTWFELAPEHAPAFRELLAALRASDEWRYVEREVEIWLDRVV